MNSFILCSPLHAFVGVIGLLVCGLFTAEALESSTAGAESLAATHQERREATEFASAETPHYYR